MRCSIGAILNRKCSIEKKFKTSAQFTVRHWNLLKVRSGAAELKSVCEDHAALYGRLYSVSQKVCCNPLNLHVAKQRKQLKTISAAFHDLFNSSTPGIVEGRKLCITCYKVVQKWVVNLSRGEEHVSGADVPDPINVADEIALSDAEVEDDGSDASNFDESLHRLNKTLCSLNQTPVKKRNVIRLKKYPARKLASACRALKDSFDSVVELSNDMPVMSNRYEQAGIEMITQLKEKFDASSDVSEKVQILLVLPKSWSIRDIQSM